MNARYKPSCFHYILNEWWTFLVLHPDANTCWSYSFEATNAKIMLLLHFSLPLPCEHADFFSLTSKVVLTVTLMETNAVCPVLLGC